MAGVENPRLPGDTTKENFQILPLFVGVDDKFNFPL